MGNAAPSSPAAYFLTFPSKAEAEAEVERLVMDGYKTCLRMWRGMWRVDASLSLPYDQDA